MLHNNHHGRRLKVKVTQSCLTLCDLINCNSPGSSAHGDSPGKNTGVGFHALLQRIFPTQGLNPGLPHCRQILCHLSHKGSPRIMEQVAYPSPGDLSDPGIKPGSPALQADFWPAELPGKPLDKHSQFLYTKEREKKREGLLIIVLRFM